jgi:hypothetical protein
LDDTERAQFDRIVADVKPPLTRTQKAAAWVMGLALVPVGVGVVAVVIGALFAAARFLWEYALH